MPLKYIGLFSNSPMRLVGLVSVFDHVVLDSNLPVIPIVCSMHELLTGPELDYLILDLHESRTNSKFIQAILRARPGIWLMVCGPPGNDDLAIEAITAGARAYLDLTTDFDKVRDTIDAVISGSICAPRRVLSQIIYRLLKINESSLNAPAHLTAREKQVVKLILKAQSNREIASNLGIDRKTVTVHVSRMMRKTGTANRIELALFMRKQHRSDVRGFLPSPNPQAIRNKMID